MKNADRLETDIRRELEQRQAVRYLPNKYGHTAYNVVMELGIGKKKSVLTGWQIDYGDNRPRFITAYPDKKE